MTSAQEMVHLTRLFILPQSSLLGEKIPYRGTKRITLWLGEEVKCSVRLKMVLFRKWMKSRSAEDRRSYEIARSEAQSE